MRAISDPVKPFITYEQYEALDVRVGLVTAAERVPKTDKLIKLLVSFAGEVRSVVTNVGDQWQPEQLVGNAYPFLLNLEPVTMRGVESAAMILGIADAERRIHLFPTQAAPGSIVI